MVRIKKMRDSLKLTNPLKNCISITEKKIDSTWPLNYLSDKKSTLRSSTPRRGYQPDLARNFLICTNVRRPNYFATNKSVDILLFQSAEKTFH